MVEKKTESRVPLTRRMAEYRRLDPSFACWAKGYGAIRHTARTQARVYAMAQALGSERVAGDGVPLFDVLYAADRLANAAMWLVAHETYAKRVYLDGRQLKREDFNEKPEGHTGGALNMVPAYVGYLAINAITGITRSWLMGQGHAVAAIDSVNLLVGNMTPAHAQRYTVTDEGLSRYVQDFYSYRLTEQGEQDSPLGSHVNANTAGGMAEGGYLGFAELQYVHMPLPGERLVVFLSDGAFEEQRGSDWAPRWWRAEDCGLVAPIMIKNGRRIDQRTTMSQSGGADWFQRHLRLNNFDPIVFDGRDPAAFVWAIYEQERRLTADAGDVKAGRKRYPVFLPYGIADAPKGAGFFGAGTNLAHNLPLGTNPSLDPVAARRFNRSARRLWAPAPELNGAIERFQQHAHSERLQEMDHPLAHRNVKLSVVPTPEFHAVSSDRSDLGKLAKSSPMKAVDDVFIATVQANPQLRPRVGNPDEMKSNRMVKTLEALKFRVTAPEEGVPESVLGHVITALNEEAVASAALANKGGINIIVTYEAFGAKMHGAVRQEIIFANHCNELGRPQKWLSIPLALTSHTWENGKNEQSHQDPVMAEALMGETSDVSRVLFPLDYNTAAEVMRQVYQTQGQIWTLVASKADSIPDMFTPGEAAQLYAEGALELSWAGYKQEQARLLLAAVGSYQLMETVKASKRLALRNVPHRVIAILEPARFRPARSRGEAEHVVSDDIVRRLFPDSAQARVFLTHTRPEPLLGVLHRLDTGQSTVGLGFINHGGTLDTNGMLFANRCTWAHAVGAASQALSLPPDQLLSQEEVNALRGKRSPVGVII